MARTRRATLLISRAMRVHKTHVFADGHPRQHRAVANFVGDADRLGETGIRCAVAAAHQTVEPGIARFGLAGEGGDRVHAVVAPDPCGAASLVPRTLLVVTTESSAPAIRLEVVLPGGWALTGVFCGSSAADASRLDALGSLRTGVEGVGAPALDLHESPAIQGTQDGVVIRALEVCPVQRQL